MATSLILTPRRLASSGTHASRRAGATRMSRPSGAGDALHGAMVSGTRSDRFAALEGGGETAHGAPSNEKVGRTPEGGTMSEKRPRSEESRASSHSDADKSEPTSILDAAHAGDPSPAAMERAWADHYETVCRYADAQIRRVGAAHLDSRSVVHTAMLTALAPAVRKCGTVEDQRRFLICSVRNEIWNYLRKRGVRMTSLPEDGDGMPEEIAPANRGSVAPDAPTRVTAHTRFEAALQGAPLSDRERAIVEHFVTHGMSWDEVAAAVGTTNNNAKRIMSLLRPKLLDHLMRPLRRELSPGGWRIVEGIFIERRSQAEVASSLGMDPGQLRERFASEVLPVFRRHYGRIAVDQLDRICGRLVL